MDARVRAVLDFIDAHYSRDLSLKELAGIGCLSEYHFSRIFSANVGATLSSYVRRVRVDRAKELLSTTDLPVTQIAGSVGYNTISAFNLAFKREAGMAPRAFRKNQEELSKKKVVQTGDAGQNPPISDFHRRIIEMNLIMVHLPDMRAAYLRQKGSYLDTAGLWMKLSEWAEARGLSPFRNQFFGISYDEPEIPDDRKTYDTCVHLPEGFDESDTAARYRTVQGGDFLLYKFYDTPDRLALAYKEIVAEWLPASAYDLDDRDFLEFSMNNPWSDPEGKCRCHLHVPVREKQGKNA